MTKNNFWGELTDVSAKKEALVGSMEDLESTGESGFSGSHRAHTSARGNIWRDIYNVVHFKKFKMFMMCGA